MQARFAVPKAVTPLWPCRFRLQPLCAKAESDQTTIPIDFVLREVVKDDVEMSFSTSSGPGGQNVNKVNTKVDMRLALSRADWIPDPVKRSIRSRNRGKMNKSDQLVVTSTRHRTQMQNVEDALEKMNVILSGAVEAIRPREMDPVKKKKLAKQRKQSNEMRLQKKKMQSMKKADRRRKDW